MTWVHDISNHTAQPSDPFRPQGNLDDNACVDNYMGFNLLSEYYIMSACELVKRSLADHCLLDVHVYAICFLYRHGLELILKDMVWKSHYLLTGEKLFMQRDSRELGRHCLTELWRKGVADSKSIPADSWPTNPSADNQVKQLLIQFERHDPGSYSFRYPIGKKTGRTHPHLINVNLRVLQDSVLVSLDRVKTLLGFIDCYYDNQGK